MIGDTKKPTTLQQVLDYLPVTALVEDYKMIDDKVYTAIVSDDRTEVIMFLGDTCIADSELVYKVMREGVKYSRDTSH